MTTLYAGYCASMEAGEPAGSARGGASSPFEHADEARALPGEAATERRCLEAAFAFVRELKNWNAIECVAAELL